MRSSEDLCRNSIVFLLCRLFLFVRPVRRPGAVAVGTELEADSLALGDRSVAFAVDHHRALSIDLDLILDALADKQRGEGLAADRRMDFDVFRTHADKNRFAV